MSGHASTGPLLGQPDMSLLTGPKMIVNARRMGFMAQVIAIALSACSVAASAQTIIDDWTRIVPPAPPALKAVTADPRSTALLLLDFNGAQDPTKGPCNKVTKPRCLASIPRVESLLDASRAKRLPVIYSLTSAGKPADIATAIAPQDGDPVVPSGPDKFVGTELAAILAAKHVKTIVIAGTAAEGAVLDTAVDAALHGFDVIVPVDGMSSTDPYAEQYVAWHLTHAPGMSKVTLTSVGLIAFAN